MYQAAHAPRDELRVDGKRIRDRYRFGRLIAYRAHHAGCDRDRHGIDDDRGLQGTSPSPPVS